MTPLARKAEAAIRQQSAIKGFITPQYTNLGLANVMPTIFQAFGATLPNQPLLDEQFLEQDFFRGVKNVVVLFLDGLGYLQLVEQLRSNKGLALRDHIKESLFFPLTSVLPSTTTAALTTVNFGLTPQEHGILGRHLYLREFAVVTDMIRLGPVIGPWEFSDLGLDSGVLFPFDTVYQRLAAHGVAARAVNRYHYSDSDWSEQLYRGAETVTSINSADAFVKTRHLLEHGGGKRRFIFSYLEMIDTVAHLYGTAGKEYEATLSSIDFSLQQTLLKSAQKDTLLIITADHGHINTTPKTTIALNAHEELIDRLAIPPTGEPRLPYLHVKDGKIEEVCEFFRDHFGRQALVYRTQEALNAGLFGQNTIYKETPHRLGDLIIMPRKNTIFLYAYTEGETATMPGQHAGLSPEEMLVPFICVRLG